MTMQYGPQEDFSHKWRTTASHSAAAMMGVYREIFYAGFPTPVQSKGNGLVAFPSRLAQDLFARFGAVTFFAFDERRGVGSVVFADGEAAEACYLSMHLSRLPSAGGGGLADGRNDPANDDGDDDGSDRLLYLEFAQYLPFVNVLLLDKELGVTGINRELLRTYPVRERGGPPQAAGSSVAGTHTVLRAGADASDARSVALFGASALYEDHAVVRAMLGLLAPCPVAPAATQPVTLLDLWVGFFQQYVVKKTAPATARLKHPMLRFASKPSPYQELQRALRDERRLDGRPSQQQQHLHQPAADSLAQRLDDEGDALRLLVVYLLSKRMFLHDPSMMSFVRDVSSQADALRAKTRGKAAATQQSEAEGVPSAAASSPDPPVGAAGASGGAAASAPQQPQPPSLADALFASNGEFHLMLESSAASDYMLDTSIVVQAERALANADWLHRARPAAYPSQGLELVLELVNRYACSGSAQSMAAICAPLATFSGAGGVGQVALVRWHTVLLRSVRTPLLVALAVAVLAVLMHVSL